jgi:hypothetical protein
VKVIGCSEIYNLPIHHLVHLYSTFGSLSFSNRASRTRCRAPRRHISRHARRARRARRAAGCLPPSAFEPSARPPRYSAFPRRARTSGCHGRPCPCRPPTRAPAGTARAARDAAPPYVAAFPVSLWARKRLPTLKTVPPRLLRRCVPLPLRSLLLRRPPWPPLSSFVPASSLVHKTHRHRRMPRFELCLAGAVAPAAAARERR